MSVSKIGLLLLCLLLLFIVSLIIGCGSSDSSINDTQGSTIDGKTLVEQRCIGCHSLDRVFAKKTDKAGWIVIVDDMIKNGAKLNSQERDKVLEYLASL